MLLIILFEIEHIVENNFKLNCIRVDLIFRLQTLLKIIKHCHEEGAGNTEVAQGVLLGLVVEDRLEITNCFSFPRHADDVDEGKSMLLVYLVTKLIVLSNVSNFLLFSELIFFCKLVLHMHKSTIK